LKLYKENTYNFEPFYSSLQSISRSVSDDSLNNYFKTKTEEKSSNLLEKQSYFIQNFLSFNTQIVETSDLQTIAKIFKLSVTRVISSKEINIFFFDEMKSKLIPFDNESDLRFTEMVNSVFKEGILEFVFESRKASVIPDVNNFTSSGAKLNYIFFPIIDVDEKKGVLALLTPTSKEDFGELENQSIELLLNVGLSKIEKLRLKEKLNQVYGELQTYQAKLTNDFRLSAIGELTEGIVEDIKTPLQVILSYADMLSKEEGDEEIANAVKDQVKKINYLVHRLVKFSSVNEERIKISPCDVNYFIIEYYNLVKSSLDNANIECVLDFEKDIPSILSHPSYIYQLLGNIISIIKASSPDGGGVIIQTRCAQDNVVVKLINTAQVQPYRMNDREALMRSSNLNYKIIENLMKIHEGEFTIESFQKSSSVITLKFPLRRKIRK